MRVAAIERYEEPASPALLAKEGTEGRSAILFTHAPIGRTKNFF